MIQFIRMLEDRDGAWDHINIVTYQAGEVYSLDRFDPPISQDLLDGFVASGHAIEVDAEGNPVATPASKRATKVTGPKATKDVDVLTSPMRDLAYVKDESSDDTSAAATDDAADATTEPDAPPSA